MFYDIVVVNILFVSFLVFFKVLFPEKKTIRRFESFNSLIFEIIW